MMRGYRQTLSHLYELRCRGVKCHWGNGNVEKALLKVSIVCRHDPVILCTAWGTNSVFRLQFHYK